jgi:hypothetical protein
MWLYTFLHPVYPGNVFHALYRPLLQALVQTTREDLPLSVADLCLYSLTASALLSVCASPLTFIESTVAAELACSLYHVLALSHHHQRGPGAIAHRMLVHITSGLLSKCLDCQSEITLAHSAWIALAEGTLRVFPLYRNDPRGLTAVVNVFTRLTSANRLLLSAPFSVPEPVPGNVFRASSAVCTALLCSHLLADVRILGTGALRASDLFRVLRMMSNDQPGLRPTILEQVLRVGRAAASEAAVKTPGVSPATMATLWEEAIVFATDIAKTCNLQEDPVASEAFVKGLLGCIACLPGEMLESIGYHTQNKVKDVWAALTGMFLHGATVHPAVLHAIFMHLVQSQAPSRRATTCGLARRYGLLGREVLRSWFIQVLADLAKAAVRANVPGHQRWLVALALVYKRHLTQTENCDAAAQFLACIYGAVVLEEFQDAEWCRLVAADIRSTMEHRWRELPASYHEYLLQASRGAMAPLRILEALTWAFGGARPPLRYDAAMARLRDRLRILQTWTPARAGWLAVAHRGRVAAHSARSPQPVQPVQK